MKKIFSFLLAVALMATMSVTAFAVDIDQNSTPKTGSTEVSFRVDPTYTIIIPATVELNKVDTEGVVTYENDYTITAEAGVRLKKGETIVVTVASDYVMDTAQGATLDYTITLGSATLENSVVATFTTSTAAQSSTIHIAANDPDYAGEYKDTVIFTISVHQAASAIINFTIDGDPYQAEEGMTWETWLESGYCADEIVDSGSGFVGTTNGYIVCMPGAVDWWYDSVRIEATIQDGLAYELLFCTGA